MVLILAALAISNVARAGEINGEPILAKYCVRCHGEKRAESDFGFAGDTPRLISSGMIVPGDPDASVIVRRIALGEMPPSGPKPSKAELATLREWISGLKQTVTFRDDSAIVKAIVDDARTLDSATRRSSRWLTLTQLANEGVGDAELDGYRNALAILLASLTWEPAPKAMVAVDAERTIYRIDLRELGWTDATWDAIRAAYPYGVARERDVPDFVRADWFVATASRGALYDTILGLPDREELLARLLGFDLAAPADARAGFNNSGVSVNNRVIERRTTRFGAYWRSYDFASSVGERNVFRHPLDFVPSGGELIFNLPDGMQAYMLVDGTGKRIAKAPTTIVSDARRPDRAVETAVSCIGCHGAGIIAHADQIRASSTDEAVLRAYPDADALTAFFTEDAARFTNALATVGATPQSDAAQEPISRLTARYESDVDLRAAAAELGLEPKDLSARIGRSSVRRELAALTTKGGTLKRDAWIAAFPRVVRALDLGLPFTPQDRRDLPPVVWIDRARRTWFAIDDVGDRTAADAGCRARRGRLPRASELVDAAAQGLAGGLHVAALDRVWARDRKLDATNQRYGLVVDISAATTTRVAPSDRYPAICIQEEH